jgi:hypothetical protein
VHDLLTGVLNEETPQKSRLGQGLAKTAFSATAPVLRQVAVNCLHSIDNQAHTVMGFFLTVNTEGVKP